MTESSRDVVTRRFVGWRIAVLATITGAMTGPGQTIGVSVFVDPIIDALDLTRSQVSTAYLIGTLLGALALPTVGRWVDRIGARRAMIAIGIAFGGGLVVMSGVQGFITLAIGFTLIRWLGQGSLSLTGTVAVTHWFERRRGTVFGVMMTGISALMSLTPVLLNLAIEAYSWRTAWLLAAAAVWLIVVPIAYFGIVDRPADVGQHLDGIDAPTAGSAVASIPGHSRREAMGEVRFWLLTGTVATTAMLITALNFHQISILGEAGLSSTEAAAMFLPQVLGAIVAGLIVGALADRVPIRFLLATAMALMTAALLMINLVEPGWQVVAYAITLGAAGGAQRPLAATVLPRWFGLTHIGAIQGISTFVGVGASALGPVAFSLARTWVGGYTEAGLLYAVIPVAIGLAALTVTEPDRSGV
ncbi:MAG: MFS transporter [Acidimicrobiales bacterium]|nr:MFS transporter [Acidimicrobiales bacterium]